MKVTILEYLNEYENPTFYGVFVNCKPKEAVIRYLLDCGLAENKTETKKMIRKNGNESVCEDVCFAYETEVE